MPERPYKLTGVPAMAINAEIAGNGENILVPRDLRDLGVKTS
jgi:hypothetical protein